ncbi:hypothetical protein Taro_004128 [Colocasia esculenta]|uniref:Uncharacterized protein n=1 Tax=Colocasia esculenta TaxID=4460 RepID=A0A843TLA1_COLES|nr:hypothetical protein [Colocasia esculenta]
MHWGLCPSTWRAVEEHGSFARSYADIAFLIRTKSFADIRLEEENFQNVKLTQLSSSKSSFACVNDAYEQVFGKDRPGRISMLGRKVKLCDMYRRPVGGGIVMAEEKSMIVMGKKLGEEYLEISVLIAYDSDAPLFVRDRDRETIKDVVGSHIIWLRDFVCVYLRFKFRRDSLTFLKDSSCASSVEEKVGCSSIVPLGRRLH